ncbi:MAG: hypothetical protein HQK78_00930, partial [Desulfobacterales bacterium]|nr:hypothetical protein [Desulfobacterales bacterium]
MNDLIKLYHEEIHKAHKIGKTFAEIMENHLLSVVKQNNYDLFVLFLRVIEIMQSKGTYIIDPSLKGLSSILDVSDIASSFSYLYLLENVFSKELNYNKCQNFSYILPKAVLSFKENKRN